MSQIDNKVTVKSQVKGMTKHDVSNRHITTMDYFKFKPVFLREMIPNETLNVNLKAFTRLAPLQKPFMGSGKIVFRSFFVPMRTIMQDWTEFIEQTVSYRSGLPAIRSQVTFFKTSDILALLSRSDYSQYNTNEPESYDFYSPLNGEQLGTQKTFRIGFYTLKGNGKRIYDILHCLGYRFSFGNLSMQEYDGEGSFTGINNDTVWSALPLLAFYKLWEDWYSSSTYVRQRTYEYYRTQEVLDFQELEEILTDCMTVDYPKDYFTSAWTNPVAPTNGSISSFSITDITQPNAATSNKSQVYVDGTPTRSSTPYIRRDDGASATPLAVSQFILDSLKRATDYIKRKQLAGVRAFDRYLADFGIQLEDAKLNRSSNLGKMEVNLEVADVMSTAETSEMILGEYAGKGIGANDGSFSYKNGNEYGFFIVTAVVLPEIHYCQGINRSMVHLKPFDFWNGDFDRLGVQPILQKELFTIPKLDDNIDDSGDWDDDAVFGFTSRYGEYKKGYDQMTGDFDFLPETYKYWEQFRKLEAGEVFAGDAFNHSGQSQFNRVFADMTTDIDHFIVDLRFNATSISPASKLFDDYQFEDGRDQSISIGGTRLD